MTATTERGPVRIRLNGEERGVAAGLTVESLLRSLELDPRRVVVEHNGVILRRTSLAGAPVRAGDAFEVVHFVGGG